MVSPTLRLSSIFIAHPFSETFTDFNLLAFMVEDYGLENFDLSFTEGFKPLALKILR